MIPYWIAVDFVIPNYFQKNKNSQVVFRNGSSYIDFNEKNPLLIRADVDYESFEADKQATRLIKTRSEDTFVEDMFAVKVWPMAAPLSIFERG